MQTHKTVSGTHIYFLDSRPRLKSVKVQIWFKDVRLQQFSTLRPKLDKPNNSRVLEEDCRREIGILDIYGF